MTAVLLITHILIAISSVFYGAYILVAPNKRKINRSGQMVAATIVTGTVLVVSTRSNMVQACVTGLLYTGLMFVMLAAAQWRLAEQTKDID